LSDWAPQEALLCAKAKRQQQMFYLRESEASAANVLSARKRSVSGKCFICAKAKRQRQSAQSERKSATHFAGVPYFNFNEKIIFFNTMKEAFMIRGLLSVYRQTLFCLHKAFNW